MVVTLAGAMEVVTAAGGSGSGEDDGCGGVCGCGVGCCDSVAGRGDIAVSGGVRVEVFSIVKPVSKKEEHFSRDIMLFLIHPSRTKDGNS